MRIKGIGLGRITLPILIILYCQLANASEPLRITKPSKLIDYAFGPSVMWADIELVQDHCIINSHHHDDGTPTTRTNIVACYSKGAIWVSWQRPQDVTHEMCHYYCDINNPTSFVKTQDYAKNIQNKHDCDRKCAKL